MRNAAADVFFVISHLGQSSACTYLRTACAAEIYTRRDTLGVTPDGGIQPMPAAITAVDIERRHRIVRVVQQYLAQWRVSEASRRLLKLLCAQYQFLASTPDQHFTEETWAAHRHIMHQARPEFYNPDLQAFTPHFTTL